MNYQPSKSDKIMIYNVVIQLITCDILSLSLGFVIAGCRRLFTDDCLQTPVCRHPFADILCMSALFVTYGYI
jgi:hypothetical protein